MEHFETLNAINVNKHTEKKKNLSYLTWAWAWAEAKKCYPEVNYNIIKFEGLPYVFDPKTGYMVYTNVTIENVTHEMWLPVMDSYNKAMKDEPYTYSTKNGDLECKAATMFDINKTIMRCLTKNLAMFGLGLYIYAGEDIPELIEEVKELKPLVKFKDGNVIKFYNDVILWAKENKFNAEALKAYYIISDEVNFELEKDLSEASK